MNDPVASVCATQAPCPICTGPLRARPDRHGRLFLSCSTCSMRVFAAGLTVGRAADLLAGFVVLSTQQGRKAVEAARATLGLQSPQPASTNNQQPAAAQATRKTAEGGI